MFSRGLRPIVMAAGLALAGCAGSVATPTLVGAPASGFDPSRVAIGSVSAEARPGVAMTAEELTRITRRVEAELRTAYPDKVAGPGSQLPASNINMVFTEYDQGNAFARAMLAGLGQIRIAANVTLLDMRDQKALGTYEVSKVFSFGGIYGAATSVEDVEEGFSHGVAAIFKKT